MPEAQSLSEYSFFNVRTTRRDMSFQNRLILCEGGFININHFSRLQNEYKGFLKTKTSCGERSFKTLCLRVLMRKASKGLAQKMSFKKQQ